MPMALFSTTDYLWCLYICKNQNEKRTILVKKADTDLKETVKNLNSF